MIAPTWPHIFRQNDGSGVAELRGAGRRDVAELPAGRFSGVGWRYFGIIRPLPPAAATTRGRRPVRGLSAAETSRLELASDIPQVLPAVKQMDDEWMRGYSATPSANRWSRAGQSPSQASARHCPTSRPAARGSAASGGASGGAEALKFTRASLGGWKFPMDNVRQTARAIRKLGDVKSQVFDVGTVEANAASGRATGRSVPPMEFLAAQPAG